ncbi:MAG: gliding motility-associated C-terminal domain-containing protein [Chitinophagales bacterium]
MNDSIQAVLRPGIQYQWSPITGLSNDTIHNPKIKVSSNRIYRISYLSAKGCQLVDTVEIKVQSPALYSPIPDQLICVGDSVQMTIPIYATNIIWSPNLTISSTTSRNPFFFPTTNQTYFLAFRDTFGCIQRDTFVFNTKICCSARARFTLSDSVLCFGTRPTITNTSKGTINFYNWNFGSTMPSSANTAAPPFLTYPTGGNYVIRLIVGNALCQDTMIKTLYLVRFKPQAGRDTANCQASYTVQLGEGSISTWSYLWKPSAYLDDPRVSNPICTILNDSVRYIVEAEDKMSGCKFTDTVTVKTNLRLDSTVSKSRICDKDSLLFNGDYYKRSGRYFYTLKSKDLKCDSLLFIKYLNVQGKDSIVYSPEVYCEFHIDKNGLRRTSSYMSIDTFKSSLGCDSFYHKKQILIFKVTYKDKDIKACNEVIFRGKKYFASKYNIDSTKIKGPYSGCDSIITRYHVIVLPKPNVSIDASRPNPLRIKDTVTLTAKGGTSYLWLQNLSTNPILNYKSNKVEEVVYTVRVTDTNNCWDTVSYKIVTEFDKECHYGIPNVFTPNNDDLNDIFIPNLSDCADIQLFAVYNRWGEKMFETNENKGWDGYYKNKLAPAGAYVYLLELKTTIGIRLHRGTFVLVR